MLLKLRVLGTPLNAGQNPINVGVSDALSAFPLHQLATVMTATINNNSVSLNVRDVLPAILRFNDRRELQRYNGYTTVAPDLLADYKAGIGSNLNSLGGWNNASDNDLYQRGAFVIDKIGAGVDGLTAVPNALPVPLQDGITQFIYVQFTSTEPLLLSPFIFADPKSNNQAFYGIQNLNMVFNVGSANRVWRSANYTNANTVSPFGSTFITDATVVSFSDTQLLFNFLTPHPSDLFPSRNTVPYYELPRFLTSNFSNISGFVPTIANPEPPVQTLSTSSLQLNQIPDKLIIQVRNPIGNTAWGQPDAFLCIRGISINFNNQSGILSSATLQDLYRYSVENGSNQSFQEFSGYATVPDPVTGCGRKIPTSGSLLILEFGKDIQLTEDYYASGSLNPGDNSDWKQFASPCHAVCA